ncbi:hypothetical protein ABFV57_31285, partial [Pseudomonas neuropathica]|uniref:hypothetical protein n=1 Tax=Pseudomonas neuropathica TaxID=2730425 RepID=UPI0034D447C8
SLLAQRVRDRSELASAATDESGGFLLTYRRTKTVNLIVQALDADGKVIAESEILFAADAHVDIDLTTAGVGRVPAPSAHKLLSSTVASQLLK